MKTLISSFALFFISVSAFAQTATGEPDPSQKTQIVEASCGQCNFNMKGDGCSLAVRIDGKPYFVEGTSIDGHGDAHAKEGFCNAIRKAEVQGEVKERKFAATYFKLLPASAKRKKHK